jgi:cation:H+ antiporter
MIPHLLWISLGLALLTAGADGLVRGAGSLALKLGLTPLVVGLTVVAFGTSAPELVVSLKASAAGQGDIAAGNVIGSNVFNIGAILGLAALLSPLRVQLQLLRFDTPLLLAVSLGLAGLLADGRIVRWEGALLSAGLVAYVAANVCMARRQGVGPVAEEFAGGVPRRTRGLAIDLVLVAGGLGLLVLGSRVLVEHAVALARDLGVAEAVIGLTIVAAGTSMPELATSLVAAAKGESDIAIGNIIGSNLFNILGILGACGLFLPIAAPGIRALDLWFMVGITAALVPMLVTGRRVGRREGCLLLAGFAAYLACTWPAG